ncbi:MAG: hypothetical protein AB7E52_00475 [Bdellovibrionales bacterium]
MHYTLLLGLISLFLFAHTPSILAETTHMPGYNCSDLGTTQISDDRTMIVACLAIVPSASPNCANAGTCKWKSMTPVVMDSSQNAALGKTTPAAKLDVVGKTLTSRDGTSECCSSGNYTAAFAENTITTGRMATLQFHNAGVHEGFLRLATGSPRRFEMGDNQGAGMGLDLNGGLKLGYDASACSSARSGALRWNGSQIQYCSGSAWKAVSGDTVPSGTLCGSAVYSGGTWRPESGYRACQGVVPGQGACPSGYSLAAPYSAYSNWLYTCMKN